MKIMERSKQYIEDLHQLHENWLIKGYKCRLASVMVIDANNDLEEMQDIFSKHARMIVEDARREKEANKTWLYKTPFQPEIISNFNRILLGTVPKLNKQILEAQDDLQRIIDLGSDYGDKEVSLIMLRKAEQLENFT